MANQQGCHSLLDLLHQMDNSVYGSTKTIQLSKPSSKQMSIASKSNRHEPQEQLILNYKKNDFNNWEIVESGVAKLTINFSGHYMLDFKKALSKIESGIGDFALSDNQDQHILYFWWYLK